LQVDAFPTGIDREKFSRVLESSQLKDKVIELQRRFDGKSLLLGIDRMDYVKGLPYARLPGRHHCTPRSVNPAVYSYKLLALEKFLIAYPQWANRITLVQIASPPKKESARYHKLRNKATAPNCDLFFLLRARTTSNRPYRIGDVSPAYSKCALGSRRCSLLFLQVHKLVGRINGRWGSIEHTPILYLDKPLTFVELVALYFLANVALISSLREGMSKVAFEFVACQQQNRGVLVLSEFIGAAQTLGSGAILVNPFNTDELAEAMYTALHMPEEERVERHQFMSE
jgi:trehalose 6-phosphate synthase/phosphatase